MLAEHQQNEGYEICCARCSHRSLWHMRTAIEAIRDAKAEGWSRTGSDEWLCPKHTQMVREGFRN
jgi:DNA-directed RNA polymerase subunit RPC12/RpoP